MEDAGLISLFHFDESGFATVPCVPYGRQPAGATLELPSFKSRRLNVLGFMPRSQQSFFRPAEGKVGAGQVIAAFDRFTAGYAVHRRPCVVNLDNAPWHTSHAFQGRLDEWATRGVVLNYLPAYSPELDPIEILWRKIKYDWLPLDCYASYAAMKAALLEILEGFGSQYQISFV